MEKARIPVLDVDKLRGRDWNLIRGAWLANIPPYRSDLMLPDPSCEDLLEQARLEFPNRLDILEDLPGIRTACLWEATTLFHKCCHMKTAAERLSASGMQTWSCFNAYHSAYVGAKGIMAILGVTTPKIQGKQVLLDLFPEPVGSRSGKVFKTATFSQMQVVPVSNQLDQHQLWECFQKILRVSRVGVWDRDMRLDLSNLTPRDIPKSRNDLLYRIDSWFVADMFADIPFENAEFLIRNELNIGDPGFFMNLCFWVYDMLAKLFTDLGTVSEPVRLELLRVRHLRSPIAKELAPYSLFQEGLRAAI